MSVHGTKLGGRFERLTIDERIKDVFAVLFHKVVDITKNATVLQG